MAQNEVCKYLKENGGEMTLQELADKMKISRVNVGRACRKLHKYGEIQRKIKRKTVKGRNCSYKKRAYYFSLVEGEDDK